MQHRALVPRLTLLIALAQPASTSIVVDTSSIQATITARGAPVTVYNSTWTNCSRDGLGPDNVDTPARGWRDAGGRVHVAASCRTARLMAGPALPGVRHNCTVVHNSTHAADPALYADNEWLHATYAVNGSTVFVLLHNEYHGFEHANCTVQPFRKGVCQTFALTAGVSRDGGWSWQHLQPPPRHLVATVPHRYVNDGSQLWFGWGDPGGIVRSPRDGYYYATAHNRATVGAQPNGTCLLRTPDLFDVAAWRGWNGTGFGARFVNPYTASPAALAGARCAPLEDQPDGALPRGQHGQPTVHQGLAWSQPLQRFVGTFWNTAHDPTLGGGAPFLLGLSADLLQWTPLVPLPVPPTADQLFYPSLMSDDPLPPGEHNFNVLTGANFSLYYTQASPAGVPHWEGLVRLPLRINN